MHRLRAAFPGTNRAARRSSGNTPPGQASFRTVSRIPDRTLSAKERRLLVKTRPMRYNYEDRRTSRQFAQASRRYSQGRARRVRAAGPATMLGDRLTVGRKTLDLLVGVRIPVPQPNHEGPRGDMPRGPCSLFGGACSVSPCVETRNERVRCPIAALPAPWKRGPEVSTAATARRPCSPCNNPPSVPPSGADAYPQVVCWPTAVERPPPSPEGGWGVAGGGEAPSVSGSGGSRLLARARMWVSVSREKGGNAGCGRRTRGHGFTEYACSGPASVRRSRNDARCATGFPARARACCPACARSGAACRSTRAAARRACARCRARRGSP